MAAAHQSHRRTYPHDGERVMGLEVCSVSGRDTDGHGFTMLVAAHPNRPDIGRDNKSVTGLRAGADALPVDRT